MECNHKELFLFFILFAADGLSENAEFCTKDSCPLNNNVNASTRYILYDVNEPEGFNLRRDVYVRMAVFANKLKRSSKEKLRSFKLILPPWINLYHWQRNSNKNDEDNKLYMWSEFFDLDSLMKFAPVIEMHQYFKEVSDTYINKVVIEKAYILQHYKDMFETGNFDERMQIDECNKWKEINIYRLTNVTAKSVQCLSFHGHVSQLKEILLKSNARSIFFDHAEVALHDRYGDKWYWQARRSMRFNKKLQKIANNYRKNVLNSDDENDGIIRTEDWTQEKKVDKKPIGGPFLCAHLRRRDFIWGRPKEVPSIAGAARQIKYLLAKLNLTDVFVATDASNKEIQELHDALGVNYKIHQFKPNPNSNIESKLHDGQVAIVDQIICSHARYFVGTHESTFSFRIQEEREIYGFPAESTFNRLCGDDAKDCSKPSRWSIVY